MPYINKHRRPLLDFVFSADFAPENLEGAGELNYLLTKLIHSYLYRNGTPHYQDYNDIVGALECCKAEFIRRKLSRYEDEKIKENGDL